MKTRKLELDHFAQLISPSHSHRSLTLCLNVYVFYKLWKETLKRKSNRLKWREQNRGHVYSILNKSKLILTSREFVISIIRHSHGARVGLVALSVEFLAGKLDTLFKLGNLIKRCLSRSSSSVS